MRALRFVSSNAGKFAEVRSVLREFGIPVQWVRRDVTEPQVDTLEAVVAAKLAALPQGRGPWLVEDSGIFLDALGGFPGVYSAYVYRTVGLPGILRLLRGAGRDATFRTVAGVRDGSETWMVRGTVRGTIAAVPRGDHGFGYDPIFLPVGRSCTFGEMTPDEKNQLSHRARALRAVGRRYARDADRPAKQM